MSNGRIVNMTPAEYRAYPAFNQSSIKAFRDDPELHHGRLTGEFENPDTDYFRFGKDFENLLFTGKVPLIPIPPEALNEKGHRRNRAGQTQWTDWLAETRRNYPDAEPATEDEYDKRLSGVLTAMENLRQHQIASALLLDKSRVRFRQCILWTDDEHGVECKAELDAIHIAGTILDVKTANSIDPEGWARDAWSHGYHVQEVWYQRAVYEVTGTWMPMKFVVVKNRPGHGCEVFELDDEFRALAQETISTWFPRLIEATQTGKYRTQTFGSIVTVSPPRWAAWKEQ